MNIVLLVLLALQMDDSEAKPAGKLCVREPGVTMVVERCATVEGRTFAIEPSAELRVVSWLSEDRSTLVLSHAPADAGEVSLPDTFVSVRLKLKGSEDRDWPQVTHLALGPRGTPDRWRVELSAFEADRLREIRVPPLTRELRFKAERHYVEEVHPDRLAEDENELGIVSLDPLPQIRGTVVDREGDFLAAALVVSEGGDVLATTDGLGEILYEAPCSGELPCLLPEWFRVEHAGVAPAWFRVVNRRRDVNLGAVRLAPGGTMELTVDRGGLKTPLTVEILRDGRAPVPPDPYSRNRRAPEAVLNELLPMIDETDGRFPPQQTFPLISSAELPPDESSVVFDDLPEGQLRVVIRGRMPGEVLSRYFHVAPEEKLELEMAIEPTIVTFEVNDERDEVAGVPVQLTQLVPPYEVLQSYPTSGEGQTRVRLWEKGEHMAHLVDDRVRATAIFEIGESPAETVQIFVRPSSVEGRVIDAETEKPVAGANLVYRSLAYQEDLAARATSDADGNFSLEDLAPGPHLAELSAEGYLTRRYRTIVLDGSRDPVTLRVGKGKDYTITARWEDGEPIPGAVYLEEEPNGARAVADDEGVIRLARPVFDPPRRFWIIPAEGSLGVGWRGWDSEIEVVLPPPGETLTLEFVDDDGRRASFAHVNFDWNQMQVSREVRLAITEIQGRSFSSGASSRLALAGMAPGHYEFWAITDLANTTWLPEHSPKQPATVHYSGMDHTAKIEVLGPGSEVCARWRCR